MTKLDWRACLGYPVGIFGPMLGWIAVIQYLLYFYTDVAGIPPAKAGLIFMLGMIWDAVSDPLVGFLADRTRTRWGRYRPYLLFGSVPFAVVVAFTFFPVGDKTADYFWLALITHLLFRTGYTLVYMPFTAMIARITTSYDSRTLLAAIKTEFIFLANLTISWGFYTLVDRFGGGEEGHSFFRAAMIVGALAALTTLICFFSIREPEHEAGPPRPRGQLMQAIPTLVKNRAFILLFFGVAIFGGFYGAEISMTAYMAKYWLGDESYTKILFTAQAVASLASIPFWYWLGVKKGKTHVWIAGVIMAATGLLGLFFLRPDNLYTMAGLYAFTNMGATGFITVFYAMTADSVDWGEWKTGQRHEGIIFGLVSFANKFAAGVASFGVGAGLALIGFKADTQLDDGQLSGMFVIGMLLPALAFLAAAALMTQYPVSRQVHGKIVADLVRK